MNIFWCTLISLFCFNGVTSGARNDLRKKVVLAHMVNTIGTVDWAIEQGANGIEIDLQFDDNGYPLEFRHGGVCDCSPVCPFGCGDTTFVCAALWKDSGSHCNAKSGAEEMTRHLGSQQVRDKLAVIYIDSKLDNKMMDYFFSGQQIVKLINKNVMEKSYKGQVVISGLECKYIDFLRGAKYEAEKSGYGSQYFYSIDGEFGKYNQVLQTLLTLGTKNIFYSTGITSNIIGPFREAISKSLRQGYAGVGIWTLDNRESMAEYLSLGVTSIVTNYPSRAVEQIGLANLAKPGEALVPTDETLEYRHMDWCDCGYRNKGKNKLWGGGCIVTTAPPPGKACWCHISASFTCSGEVVGCKDPGSQSCNNPTPATRDTCQQSEKRKKLDCDGYKWVTTHVPAEKSYQIVY